MSELETLPYRPCVGIMLANMDGKIFVGQRLDNPNSQAWQMPQGGIDEGEDSETAAMRELHEETGVRSELVEIISRCKEELFYDLPPELVGKLWRGKYRGQRQIWYLMRFLGTDTDIDIASGHPEFSCWQWCDPRLLPKLIVPFKRRLYEQILEEFSDLI